MSKGKFIPLIIVICLSLFFLFIFRSYYQRIGAFGCFDDCFNIAAGYFIGEGKTLYSEIFFNHQPLMAYVSFAIQKLGNPATLYQLILYHRIFILAFALLADAFLIWRFRLIGIGFVLLYETTKFYAFGDRFLAESIITYLLVYMFLIVLYALKGKKVYNVEIIIAGILTWLVVFMREPFVPLAFFLYGLLLFHSIKKTSRTISLLSFTSLSITTLAILPITDYVFNVFTVNAALEVRASDIFGENLLKIIAYPLYILIGGESSFFRTILTFESITFLLLTFLFLRIGKRKEIILALAILALANIRVVEPGSMYYEAFHMAPWYGLFIATILLFIKDTFAAKRLNWLARLCVALLVVVFLLSISKGSFFWEKIDKDSEFTTNYAHYFVQGEIIKTLANSEDSLFVDGFDELIHVTADLPSPYPYSLYTSVMPLFPKYYQAREVMFRQNTPDFYYGSCPHNKNPKLDMPQEEKRNYAQLAFKGAPTCLFVNKTKLPEIKREQLEKVQKMGFSLF